MNVPALETLRNNLRQLKNVSSRTLEVLPFRVSEIDNCLPNGGLTLGSLHDVMGGDSTYGASATLFIAGILARTEGPVLWCLRQHDLFAPALAQVGLDADRVVYAEAPDEKTLLACFEEGLRHGGVAAVVGEIGKLPMLASRRLQLAAEETGTLAIALRRFWRAKDAADFDQPTAARTRWRISASVSPPLSMPGVGRAHWKVELVRCRSGAPAGFEVEACDEKGYLGLSTPLADGSAHQSQPVRQQAAILAFGR